MDDLTTLIEMAPAPVKSGGRWLVTIATPGKGSTGTYTEDVLRITGPKAFPAGTKAFFNHDSKRDVRDMVGTYEEGAFWNDEEGVLQALLTPFPRYKQVLEEAGKNIEASVHVAAYKDVGTGYIRELKYDRSNTVDLVAFAGLEGSGLKYQVESLFTAASAAEDEGKEEKNMDEKELTRQFEALAAKMDGIDAKFDTFVAESKVEVKGEADQVALDTAVAARLEEALAEYAIVEATINAADILDIQKESLKASARKGDDITQAMADAVTFVEEAKKALVPDAKGNARAKLVVVTEDNKSDAPKTFTVGRWS